MCVLFHVNLKPYESNRSLFKCLLKLYNFTTRRLKSLWEMDALRCSRSTGGQDHCVEELAPTVYARTSTHTKATTTVAMELEHHDWARDIRPDLIDQELLQFLWLWSLISNIQLSVGARIVVT